MKALYSLFLVLILTLIALVGSKLFGMEMLFGAVLPYVAVVIFSFGFIFRLVKWGRSPVPFAIPTTCGQQESSLPMIKQSKIDCPSTSFGVVIRMALEVLTFRSLFRNTRLSIQGNARVTSFSSKWLWAVALAFHYTFLVVLIRHLRFFIDPLPFPLLAIDWFDSFFKIGVPTLYLTDLVFLGAVCFLLVRRFVLPQIRYISLAADYFPLFLIIGIILSGISMRYFAKTDVIAIKNFTMSLVHFKPVIPVGIDGIFYVHIFLVSFLLAYFPFSKLMHMGGVFFSPTRNMKCSTRKTRYENPWKFEDVHYHTYSEYEDEFREKMIEADLPVEKESV